MKYPKHYCHKCGQWKAKFSRKHGVCKQCQLASRKSVERGAKKKYQLLPKMRLTLAEINKITGFSKQIKNNKMISINEVERSIKIVSEQMDDLYKRTGVDKTEAKRLTDRFKLLESVKAYVQTSPSHDFVAKEKDRLKECIKNAELAIKDWGNGFEVWDAEFKKQRNTLIKELGLKKHKEHLRSIEYILGE